MAGGRAPVLVRALCAVSLTMLVGCSTATRFAVNADGSGQMQAHLTLAPFMVAFLRQNGELPDASEIRRELSERPGVTVGAVTAAPSGTFDIDLAFADITTLVDRGLEAPFTFATSSDGTHTLTMTYSAMSWQSFLAIPVLDDAIGRFSLGPGHAIDESMFRDWVSSSFSADIAAKSEVVSALDHSRLVITVAVNGSVVSQTGGTTSGNEVTWTFPLVELGTTGGPLPFSVSFR